MRSEHWVVVALAVAVGVAALAVPVREGIGPPPGSLGGPNNPNNLTLRTTPRDTAKTIKSQVQWYFEMPESPYNWTPTIMNGMDVIRP